MELFLSYRVQVGKEVRDFIFWMKRIKKLTLNFLIKKGKMGCLLRVPFE